MSCSRSFRVWRWLTIAVFLASGLVLSGPQSLAAWQNPQVDVVGLSVALPDPDNEYGQSMVPGRLAGTEVTLRVVDKGRFFLGQADGENGEPLSSLDLLDDQGNKLKKEDDFSYYSMDAEVSEDGSRVVMVVHRSDLPPAQCKELQVKGTIELLAGTSEITEKTRFKVANGTEATLGGIEVKLSDVSENPYGEPGRMFTVESAARLDTVAEITFLDDKGKDLESMAAGEGAFGFGDEMTYSRTYIVEGAVPDELTARVRYFRKTEKVPVPVDLTVSLALGQDN